jgi:hypothetical protein
MGVVPCDTSAPAIFRPGATSKADPGWATGRSAETQATQLKAPTSIQIAMARSRWQDRDGKIAMARSRWQDRDGKIAMVKHRGSSRIGAASRALEYRIPSSAITGYRRIHVQRVCRSSSQARLRDGAADGR